MDSSALNREPFSNIIVNRKNIIIVHQASFDFCCRLVIIILTFFTSISSASSLCEVVWKSSHVSNTGKRGKFAEAETIFTIDAEKCPYTLKTDEERIKVLTGKKIVMIGDSVQRNLYTNLAHFVQTKEWHSLLPHIEYRTDFGLWERYFTESNLRFGCYEYCDCCIPEDEWRGKTEETVEIRSNRYYYNPH